MGARASFPIEDITCPVCSEIFKNPVLLNCSHNVCKECLDKFWQQKKSWNCPVCRKRCTMNPPFNLALNKLCNAILQQRALKTPADTMTQQKMPKALAASLVLRKKQRPTPLDFVNEIIEKNSSWYVVNESTKRSSAESGVQVARQRASAESGVQVERRRASTASGVQVASQRASAESGIQVEHQRGSTASGVQVEHQRASTASGVEVEHQRGSLESEGICSLHGKKFKLFCLEDLQPICVECRESHKPHRCVPVDEAVPDLREELKTVLKPFKLKLDIFTKVKQTFDQTAKHIKNQFQHTEQILNQEFEKLNQFLQDEQAARIAALRLEEEQKSRTMSTKIEEMIRNVNFLSDTIKDIEKELESDEMSFLQNFRATKEISERTLPNPQLVSGSLIDVAKHLGNLQFRVWEKMQAGIKYTPVVLDPNTAHPSLYVSDDLSSVSRPGICQLLPDNPERCMKFPEILGSEGFSSGKHTWIVRVRDHPEWFLGVANSNNVRKGDLSVSPKNGIWCIMLDGGFYRAGGGIWISMERKPQDIRVQLDYDEGEVSFYDPKDMTHIYTHKDTFTTELFPYFNVGKSTDVNKSGVQICQSDMSLTIW